jgi:3-deoxy-D-manno-octulosonic acid (KDO) 8-phosphate synthase
LKHPIKILTKNKKTFVYTNKISVISTNKQRIGMKIEDIIKTTAILNNSNRIILNVMYTENVINEKFNEVLKPYELSGEQYNVLRILRGQKGIPLI